MTGRTPEFGRQTTKGHGMESSYNEREAIRAYVVQAVTLILDNERSVHGRLTTVACDAVRDDMGHPSPGRDAFEQALRGGDREGYVRAVGRAVCTELEEIMEELRTPDTNGDDLLYRLLIDLIDLSDSRQADLFGEHYLPEDADDIEWEDDDDEQDDDDPVGENDGYGRTKDDES